MNRKPFVKPASLAFLAFLLVALAIPALPPDVHADSMLISLNKPASALSSEAGGGPELVNDADASNNSYWGSFMGEFSNTWWQVDLEGTYRVNQVSIRNWVDGIRYYHYHIRGSLDGVHWYPIAAKSNNNPATDGGDTYAVDSVARYLRVNVTHNSANQSAHISDFKAYGVPIAMPASPPAEASAHAGQGAYLPGTPVTLQYELINTSPASLSVTGIKAKVFGISDPTFLHEISLAGSVSLPAGQTYTAAEASLWTPPAGTPPGAYGVTIQYKLANGEIWEAYETFFRVTSASELTVYEIDKLNYNGLEIFALDGGMSAEFAVEKAGEALGRTVSHSWYTSSQGSGPNPVYATPEFLEKSVQATVDFYNDNFGSTTKYDTVIFSTGVPSAPYLSRTMKAPVLPLHFLTSLQSIKELQSILDYSAKNGIEAYSTLGYDGSVEPGVAWLKLLDLPPAYRDFLNDHKVKYAVIMGSSGNIGESTARKILEPGISTTETNPGDIFVMYPGGGGTHDFDQLTAKIKDVGEFTLEPTYQYISDWESGIIPEQVEAFADSMYEYTCVKVVDKVSGFDSLNLYEFASYATLAFYKKNETVLSAEGQPVAGITLNPYLISHPFYETKLHYVPFLFWQFGDVNHDVDVRLNQRLRAAVNHYFPNIDFDSLSFWIDASNNFGRQQTADRYADRLEHNGLTLIETQDYTADEVWNPADGMNAPVERTADNLLQFSSPQALAAWDNTLKPLTLKDLEEIPAVYSEIQVSRVPIVLK